MNFTSRSAYERYQRCHRARYWEYHYNGVGIVPHGVNLDLEIGTAVHHGLALMLAELQRGTTVEKIDIAECIKSAMADFQAVLEEGGAFAAGDEINELWAYQIEEAKALVEGFLWAWATVKLEGFAERFTVLSVEDEELYPLAEDLMLGGRLDAIVQSKTDPSEVKIISWKTIKEYDERVEKAASHDNQGISETLVAEHRFRSDNKALADYTNTLLVVADSTPAPKWANTATKQFVTRLRKKYWPTETVASVLMGYFLKGSKGLDSQAPEGVKRYIHSSPLIRGYRKFNKALGEWEYAWNCFPPSDTTKSGKTRLGAGWERFDVWAELPGGVREWIEMLASEEDGGMATIQPECGWCLPQQMIEVEHCRVERDVKSWLRQITSQETSIVASLAWLQNGQQDWDEALDEHFGQTRSSCHYPTDCPYIPACFDLDTHENPLAAADQYGEPLYQIRVPHHEPERLALEGGK